MDVKYLQEFTWYYDKDGRIWMVLAVILNDVLNQKVWLVEAGVNDPTEYPFERVAKLILDGTLKLYIKPKIK